jgi:hypothetical protein
LTRHNEGFVRERHLKKIIGANQEWVPPFVVQLVGEYVIEILDVIWNNIHNLDAQLYKDFLADNPTLLARTKQRVVSYWDCYHRDQTRDNYVGFRITEFFDSLSDKSNLHKELP